MRHMPTVYIVKSHEEHECDLSNVFLLNRHSQVHNYWDMTPFFLLLNGKFLRETPYTKNKSLCFSLNLGCYLSLTK